MDIVFLIGGLILLIFSGELLVKGAVGTAKRFNVSTLVIGLTIVSFGTSAPELLVSLRAAFKHSGDIAIGAVIGSNVSNLGLVLGLSAMVYPIKVSSDTIKIDWRMMMLATVWFILSILDNKLSFFEGLTYVILLVLFNYWIINRSRKLEREKISERSKESSVLKHLGLIVAGSVGLTYGADLFLDGAVGIAEYFGLSHRVIGITVVAVGTSLPELITAMVAAFRKETDISIGNLIGSNIFNILAILGITSLVKTIDVNEKVLEFDVYWLFGISLLLLPLMYVRKKVGRISGMLLLLVYLSYISLVIL